MREEALHALRGSELIIHAGDVGGREILEALEKIAPVIAVRGNTDHNAWGNTLPVTAVVEVGPAMICVLHNIHELDLDPAAGGFQMVVSGHSHKPSKLERDGVIYLNPGSAGPRRFQLPVTVALLDAAVHPWKIDFVPLLKDREASRQNRD
jgi:hypothetical protein